MTKFILLGAVAMLADCASTDDPSQRALPHNGRLTDLSGWWCQHCRNEFAATVAAKM